MDKALIANTTCFFIHLKFIDKNIYLFRFEKYIYMKTKSKLGNSYQVWKSLMLKQTFFLLLFTKDFQSKIEPWFVKMVNFCVTFFSQLKSLFCFGLFS